MYNWQLPNWPEFQFDTTEIEDLLLEFASRAGRNIGIVEALPQEQPGICKV
ncbi:MAG: DUF4172 domain-containing protein [Cyclobacteriaceae bacterium]